jgi:hypothetical protein
LDHGRAFFLDCNGREYRYETGHRYRIAARALAAAPERPAGLKYALTFLGPDDACQVRCDNGHAPLVPGRTGPATFDHWHRHGGLVTVPCDVRGAETLLADFCADIDPFLPEHLRSR